MNRVFIDTSVWIDFFSGGEKSAHLDRLLDEDRVSINKIVKVELYPFLSAKKQNNLIELLEAVTDIPLFIDWDKIIGYQTINIKNSLKRIGIPDLIILDHVIQNDLALYTLDKPFSMMAHHIRFKIFRS
jgi:predicted nucleic acid-binding protein